MSDLAPQSAPITPADLMNMGDLGGFPAPAIAAATPAPATPVPQPAYDPGPVIGKFNVDGMSYDFHWKNPQPPTHDDLANAVQQLRSTTAHQSNAFLNAKDPQTETALQQYAQKYFSDSGKGSTPANVLDKISLLPPGQRYDAIPAAMSQVGKIALMRAAWNRSGQGSSYLTAQPPPPGMLVRAATVAKEALAAPANLAKALIEPVNYALQTTPPSGEKYNQARQDQAEMARIAALPIGQRMEALSGQGAIGMGQPNYQAAMAKDYATAGHLKKLGLAAGELFTNISTDPVAWALQEGILSKAPALISRAVSGTIAAQVAAPYIANPKAIASDPERAVVQIPFAVLAGLHASGAMGEAAAPEKTTPNIENIKPGNTMQLPTGATMRVRSVTKTGVKVPAADAAQAVEAHANAPTYVRPGTLGYQETPPGNQPIPGAKAPEQPTVQPAPVPEPAKAAAPPPKITAEGFGKPPEQAAPTFVKPQETPPQENARALQESEAGALLQRQQEEVAGAGGGRGGVEQVQQGQETPSQGQAEGKGQVAQPQKWYHASATPGEPTVNTGDMAVRIGGEPDGLYYAETPEKAAQATGRITDKSKAFITESEPLQNPYVTTHDGLDDMAKGIAGDILDKNGVTGAARQHAIDNIEMNPALQRQVSAELTNQLKAAGHDGVVFNTPGHDSYMVKFDTTPTEPAAPPPAFQPTHIMQSGTDAIPVRVEADNGAQPRLKATTADGHDLTVNRGDLMPVGSPEAVMAQTTSNLHDVLKEAVKGNETDLHNPTDAEMFTAAQQVAQEQIHGNGPRGAVEPGQPQPISNTGAEPAINGIGEPSGEAARGGGVGEPVAQALQEPAIQPNTAPAAAEGQQGPVVPATTEAATPAGEVTKPGGGIAEGTGAKNAVTEQERADRGLVPEVVKQIYKGPVDSYLAGKDLVDTGKVDPRVLAATVSDKPRVLTPEETGALTYDRMRIINEAAQNRTDTAALMDKIDKQGSVSGDDAARIAELKDQAERVDNAYQRNDEALQRGGRENSAALNSRKMLVKPDYTPLEVKQRIRIMQNGDSLTPKQDADVERLTKMNSDLTELLKKAEERASIAESARQMELDRREAQAQTRTRTRTDLKADYEVLKDKLTAALGKTAGRTPMAAGLVPDPDTVAAIAPILRDMAKNLVAQGVNNIGDLVDRVHADVVDKITDISKRNVRDIISGYGEKTATREAGRTAAQDTLARFRDLQKQAELLSKTEDVRAGIQPSKRSAPGKPSPEVQELQVKFDQAMKDAGFTTPRTPPTTESRQARMADSLKQRIADLDRRIQQRDFSKTAGGTPTAETPEITALKAQRADLNKTYQRLRNEAQAAGEIPKPARNPLPAMKSALNRQIADMERRIATGDIGPRAPRTKPVVDAEVTALQNRRAEVRMQLEKMIQQAKKPSLMDKVFQWQRGALTLGAGSAAKVGAAVNQRIFTDMIDEIPSGIVSMLNPRLAAHAPREGGSMNLKAEVNALKAAFSPRTALDALNKLRTGSNSMDVQNYINTGKLNPNELHTRSLIEMGAALHGAMKTPTQKSAYEYGLAKRTAQAIKNGLDVNNPEVETLLQIGAYADSQRAILMNPNAITDFLRAGPARLEQRAPKSVGANAAANLVRMQTPIARVPSNFAGDTAQYALGGPYGFAKAVIDRGGVRKFFRIAIGKDADTLTDDQADSILRAYKKQSIGVATTMAGVYVGYNSYKAATAGKAQPTVSSAGYYYPGEKQQLGEQKTGDVGVGKHVIPHLLTHNPLLASFQVGATFGRALGEMQDRAEVNPQVTNPALSAAYHTGVGFVKQLPFAESITGLANAGENESSFGKTVGEQAGTLIPQAVQEAARYTDRDINGHVIPRDARGFKDTLKTKVPVLRRQVPLKVNNEVKSGEIIPGPNDLPVPKAVRQSKGTTNPYATKY